MQASIYILQKKMQINYNQIAEISGLDHQKNLVKLDLGFNNISELKGLENLNVETEIDLIGNIAIKNCAAQPSEYVEFCKLKKAGKLETVQVKGKKYHIFEGFVSLRDLGITSIKEIEGLDKLTELKSLFISSNNISKIDGLDKLQSLEYLNLMSNKITDISGLKKLHNLRQLHIGENNISKIKGLENLKNLVVLDIRENHISEIKGLDTLKNLTNLDLRKNKISDIRGLGNLHNLEVLVLVENPIPEELISLLGGVGDWSRIKYPQKFVDYCQKPFSKEKQKERLKKALGPMSDRALEGTMDYLAGYEQTQNENLEKAKILLGDDYIKNLLEENPNATHSFHLPEPYDSMSLEELRRVKGIEKVERVEQEGGISNSQDDIFTEVFDKYADFLTKRDKDLLRDAFSGVDKKKKKK